MVENKLELQSKGVISDNNDSINNNQIYTEKEIEIEKWLKQKCQLSQYRQNFICNGYKSLEDIKEIDNKDILLNKIGIKSIGHRTTIWSEIKKQQTFEVTEGEYNFLEAKNDVETTPNDENEIVIIGEDEITPKK